MLTLGTSGGRLEIGNAPGELRFGTGLVLDRASLLVTALLAIAGVAAWLAVALRASARARRVAEADAASARRELDDARAALADARAAARGRDEVMSIVSHDLKTPLNALLVGAQMVERLAPATPDGDGLRRAAMAVRRTGERMARLVHDLVDAAGLESGKLSMRLGAHDAGGVAREAIDAVRAISTEHDVRVAAGDLAHVTLRCDRDRLLQVLVNLLSNAVQVSPPGSRVELRVDARGGEALLTVRDSGPGIPAEDLPHLFERWYRGARPRYPGSGLGLAIAHGIVQAHGGRIAAESVEGQGCTFTVALPIHTAEHAP